MVNAYHSVLSQLSIMMNLIKCVEVAHLNAINAMGLDLINVSHVNIH